MQRQNAAQVKAEDTRRSMRPNLAGAAEALPDSMRQPDIKLIHALCSFRKARGDRLESAMQSELDETAAKLRKLQSNGVRYPALPVSEVGFEVLLPVDCNLGGG